MADLFYSHDEKLLFLIAGYTDNSQDVNDIISMLKKHSDYMRKLSGNKKIFTDFIEKSRRYAQMRVFYCRMETPPKEAFIIGGGENKWTMHQWLHD